MRCWSKKHRPPMFFGPTSLTPPENGARMGTKKVPKSHRKNRFPKWYSLTIATIAPTPRPTHHVIILQNWEPKLRFALKNARAIRPPLHLYYWFSLPPTPDFGDSLGQPPPQDRTSPAPLNPRHLEAHSMSPLSWCRDSFPRGQCEQREQR